MCRNLISAHISQMHLNSICNMKSIEVRLVGRFRFESKLPGNHEHLLYKAIHTQNQSYVFLKGDEHRKKISINKLSILQEGKILQMMQGGIGIPHMHWCGQEEDYHFIVLEELSNDFQMLLHRCGGMLSLKSALMFGIQAISILQYFHFKNFLHCSLSPKHFMIGTGAKFMKIFLVDYSSAVRFRDNQTLEHIEEEDKVTEDQRTNNLEFSSASYQSGQTPSRKDDVISLLYVLAYLQKGELPWSKYITAQVDERQQAQQILSMKSEMSPEQIFADCPDLANLYVKTLALGFEEKPRYSYYKNVFRQRIEREGEIEDNIYDWILLEEEIQMPIESLGLDLEIIPNEVEFVQKLEDQIQIHQKAQSSKISLTETVNQQKMVQKDKECVIF